MFNKSESLVVIKEDSTVFSSLTIESSSFINDTFNVELLDTDDYLYVGYHKPISCFYAALLTGAVNGGTVSFEYYDGTSWVSLDVSDGTSKLTRSGFISFDSSLLNLVEVNGDSSYYIRMQYVDSVEFRGMGCLFSDDEALSQEYYEIINDCLYSSGFDSHITAHLSARNHILQLLKNEGYMLFDSNCDPKDLTCFDLLDMSQVKLSATYLALSNIFLRMSDSEESIYWEKYKEYQMKFEETFKSLRLTLDTNGNGVLDDGDQTVVVGSSFSWSR